MKLIDDVLNRITMYRLILYYLIFLLAVAFAYSILGVLNYDPYALLFSTGFLVAVAWLTNTVFSKAFGVPTNHESAYISALILALIITPIASYGDLWFLGWAAVWAMASKYILAPNKKHIFNPVAFAVALTYLTTNQSASWWVGNAAMLPFVVLGGALIVRKIRRWDMVYSFLAAAVVTTVAFTVYTGGNLAAAFEQELLLSPLFFFAFVILTEPLTTPPTQGLRILYGALVGVLFSPVFHIGSFFTTPEIAILLGNVYSYLVSPKSKLILRLKEKIQISPDTFDFIFSAPRKFAFAPGQYMEWTLGLQDPDARGNRRYFTLASAPTEQDIRVGVKFHPEASTFKQTMLSMDENTEIVAGQLAGDFTLPGNTKEKLVFIAGGIGVTPFRSMLKYLLDKRQPRDIVLFYSNRTPADFVYVNVLEQARRELGLRTVYTVTDPTSTSVAWRGSTGRISADLIRRTVPDYRRRLYYVSGPQEMVDSTRAMLKDLGVPDHRVKSDYFPGLA